MKVVIIGAPGGTTNLGVDALRYSLLAAVWDHDPSAQVVVADYGRGVRRSGDAFGGEQRHWAEVGMVSTRRWYRSESLVQQRVMAAAAPRLLPATRALADADVVLDVSGGDSFTDLYGENRFETVAAQKEIALEVDAPLALPPQTFGPFAHEESRRRAAEIVARVRTAWSRDAASHAVLLDLLGDRADERRHRRGVDVAFALGVVEPHADDDPGTRTWLAERDDGRPLAGINVSGLVRRDPGRFGIEIDYVEALARAVRALVERDADVLLVPHQTHRAGIDGPGDHSAATALHMRLGDLGDRVRLADYGSGDPRQAKWWISQCSWFTGPRMHATIAAISTGVPTLATAYSMKVAGVFDTAGIGDSVVDLRTMTNEDELVRAMVSSFEERDDVAASLARSMPDLRRRARDQMDEVIRLARG